RRRVDADRVGLAGERVAIELTDAQRFGGLVEVEQDRRIVIVDATAELRRGRREQRAVLVVRGLVVLGAIVELGGPERELAIALDAGGGERRARGGRAVLDRGDRGSEQRAVLGVLVDRGLRAMRGR